MVTKPQSREPVGAEMRGKKGLAGGKGEEREEGIKPIFLASYSNDRA